MNTLDFLKKRYNLTEWESSPIYIDGSRFRELPKLFQKLGFTSGAEIGVRKGLYSKLLCKYNPNMRLYSTDPWQAYDGYAEFTRAEGQKILDGHYNEAVKRLEPFNCEIIRKKSQEALEDFDDESLDFVFIDGNHTFEYVINDIAGWEKKIRPGGIVSGHDYWNSYAIRTNPYNLGGIKICQVKDAIDAWTKANQITPWFLLKKDKCPSWFYVKQ